MHDTLLAKLHRSRSVCDLPSLGLRPPAARESYVSVLGLAAAGLLCLLFTPLSLTAPVAAGPSLAGTRACVRPG